MNARTWISGEQHTIPSLLERASTTDPDSEYLDVVRHDVHRRRGGRRAPAGSPTAWRDLGRRARATGSPTLVENSPEAMLAWWGAVRGGHVAVPINTAYKGQYLRHQLHDSGARGAGRAAQPRRPRRRGRRRPPRPRATSIVVDDGERRRRRAGVAPTAQGRRCTRGTSCCSADATTPDVTIRPSDLGTFVYTGGTTGPSKGCMLSHNYHEALARQIGICWGRTADDVVWTPLPLFHFNALVTAVLGALVFGGRVGDLPAVLGVELLAGDEPHRRDDHLDARHDGLPARPRRRPARDAEVGCARGEHVAAPARRGAAAGRGRQIIRERFGVETFSGAYGVTEASLISWQPPGVRNKPNAAGVINDEYFDVRIFDDDDNEVAARTPTARSSSGPKRPHVMFEGYWGRPEATVDDQPQLVVPHRRHRPDRRRRLPLLRRPQGRLPAPPGREHLELRGRERSSWATARSPTSPCTPCRAS